MEGIKNLIIDLGGVLINLTRNRCIEAFENLGVENIREQITNNYQHKDLFERLELGTISVEQFRDDIRALSGKPDGRTNRHGMDRHVGRRPGK